MLRMDGRTDGYRRTDRRTDGELTVTILRRALHVHALRGNRRSCTGLLIQRWG